MTGAAKEKCPPTGNFYWADVRDIALAHVLVMEKQEAAGLRFFMIAGLFCNKEIAEIIREAYPESENKLPAGDALALGDYPEEGTLEYDNSRSIEVLELKYRSLREYCGFGEELAGRGKEVNGGVH